MKILIISSFPTHPTYAGNSTSIKSYATLLINQGHDVSFLWITNNKARGNNKDDMEEFWGEKLKIFEMFKIQKYINLYFRKFRFNIFGYYKIDDLFPFGLLRFLKNNNKEEKYDVVIVNYIFFSKAFLAFNKNEKKIIYTHDIFTDRFQKTGNQWFSTNQKEECKGLNRSDVIWSIQEEESDFFRSLTNKKIYTTYCHFPINKTINSNSQNILFLAGSNVHNLEAIELFVHNDLPQLKIEFPELKLIIGGKICEKIEYMKSEKNIVLCGEVNDLADFYRKGDIFINPTFSGTGLKIKTFEAMSFGKVVISHSHNVSGIFKIDKAPIFIQSNIETYCILIKRLLENRILLQTSILNSIEYINELNNYVKDQTVLSLSDH